MILNEMIHGHIFTRKIFTIAFPVTLQNLVFALVAVADALMLRMANQDAMAAVSPATQIQFVQNMLLGAIIFGIGVLGAQCWGKDD